jgi:DnaJ-domain-containing proteins 1
MNFFVFLGGLIGFMTDRFAGLLVGALIGYLFARFVAGHLGRAALRGAGSAARRMQTRFLDSTFAVMGAVCKADGQVSEQEIRMAEQLFAQLHMDQAARESARIAFRRGKSPGFDLDAEVAAFATAARGNRMLLQMFLQVQLSAMTADGALHPAERQMLLRIARGLGISQAEVESLEALLRGGYSGAWQGRAPAAASGRPTARIWKMPTRCSASRPARRIRNSRPPIVG